MKLAIVGTGTGIGKTHLGLALLTGLTGRGISACGMKPVESGIEDGIAGDGELLEQASSCRIARRAPYRLRAPLSPHLAARQEGITIELDTILAWLEEGARCGVRILETAGGLLSPLSRRDANLDLVRAWAPDVTLLVASDRLGVLHEVTATMHLLRRSTRHLCVLQAPETPDLSTGTNAAELAWLGVVDRVVSMPRGLPASDGCQKVVGEMLETLEIGART